MFRDHGSNDGMVSMDRPGLDPIHSYIQMRIVNKMAIDKSSNFMTLLSSRDESIFGRNFYHSRSN